MSNDAQVIRELVPLLGGDEPRTILHYLYMPSEGAADWVANHVKQRGLRIEQCMGADGVNWLVLARQEAVPNIELITSTRQSMEALVAQVGGEYDGWEVEVGAKGTGSEASH